MKSAHLCYTDGSVKAGDGAPGGWGFCVRGPDGAAIEGHGKAVKALAKVMEYTAVAEALAVLPEGAQATVFSDSQSLVENLTRRLAGWREGGFRKVDPEIVEIVRRIDALLGEKKLAVEWQWIRGHNGNAGNERADALAAQGAREAKADLEAEEQEAKKVRREKWMEKQARGQGQGQERAQEKKKRKW